MAVFYQGSISVQDNDFHLYADRFIPLKDSGGIDFSLSGVDNLGKFKIDGTARLSPHGFYWAPGLKLIYEDSNIAETLDRASIRIGRIKKMDKQMNQLDFEGRWTQDGTTWKIWGVLDIGVLKKTTRKEDSPSRE